MVRARERMWGLFVATALALGGGLLPGAAAPAGALPAAAAQAPSAADLRARVQAITTELGQLEDATRTAQQELEDARARVIDGQRELDEAGHTQDAARTRLSRYAVDAYVNGHAREVDLTVSLLSSDVGDIDTEGRRVLATTVHSALVHDARVATDQSTATEAQARLAEQAAADAEAHLDELERRRAALQDELATTQSAAQQAQAREEAEAAERERRAAEQQRRDDEQAARAATPRPTAVHSGVVPSATVRANIVALFGGEIGRTALDAYYRGAVLTNRSMPGCAIDWALIGAIGRVETNHGTFGGSVVAPDGSTSPTILGIPLDGRGGTAEIRDTDQGALDGDPLYDRAVGPMQFIPGTWRAYARDGNGDGVADPHNIYDAAFATGTYLCSTGGGPLNVAENASRAVYAYNRSAEYNVEVLTLADHYRRTIDPTLPPPTAPPTVPKDPGDLPPPASPPGDPVPPDPGSPTTSTPTPTTTPSTTVDPSSTTTTTSTP